MPYIRGKPYGIPFINPLPNGMAIKVIKAECSDEFKQKLESFLKKSGEKQAELVRTAVKNYIDTNGARK